MIEPAAEPGHLFIVGSARTGSTLLQHVLNRSPDICLAPETHFMKRARRLQLGRRLAEADSPSKVRELADRLYRIDSQSKRGGWAWLRRNIPMETFVQRLMAMELSEHALFDLLMTLYAERTKPGSSPSILGEKTPGHLFHVPHLLEWYPNARILHTFRDPRAIYVSELIRRRQGRWGMKAGPMKVLGGMVDPLLAPFQMAHTAIRWSQAVRLDRRYERELGPRYLRVRFEDLVSGPEEQLQLVCDFIGIPYDRSLLDVRITGSSYSEGRHAGAGFDPAAATRWRAHVGTIPDAWFAAILGSKLARYGYAR